jgi:Archaeal holliday junction resolvase (hjc)
MRGSNNPAFGKKRPDLSERNRSRRKFTPEYTRQLLEEYKLFKGGLRGFIKTKGFGSYQQMLHNFQEFFPDEWEAIAELHKGNGHPYSIGRAFEYRVKKHYKDLGYFVLRSAGSRGPVDLLAVSKGSIHFVQCKIDGVFDHKTDRTELIELASSVGAKPILAWRKGGRGAEIILEELKQ